MLIEKDVELQKPYYNRKTEEKGNGIMKYQWKSQYGKKRCGEAESWYNSKRARNSTSWFLEHFSRVGFSAVRC